eukprot:GHUV01007164.1.p1 GENE.GHUV01007164.1~~GHUV01007164.1.p1  ORF type:complete len:338 (+),score=142.30 GHUV01007164.1:2958-3971(+)
MIRINIRTAEVDNSELCCTSWHAEGGSMPLLCYHASAKLLSIFLSHSCDLQVLPLPLLLSIIVVFVSSLQKRAYRITSWTDSDDFLAQLARSTGKLLKGGDPDLNTAARIVLYDWQRGKIPFYTLPPGYSDLPPGVEPATAAAKAADAAGQQSEQQQQMFTAAVTAEDAAAEAGAKPENAAAAAQALRDAAAAVLRKQRHSSIPTKEDYYLPDDEQGCGGDAISDEVQHSRDDSEADSASSSSCDSDAEESEQSDSDDRSDDQQQQSDSDAAESDDPAAAATAAEGSADHRRQKQQRVAADAAAADSGDESDGYGEAGLSWEAVMQAVVQVGFRGIP